MAIARRLIDTADLIVAVWDGTVTAEMWSSFVDQQVANPDAAQAKKRLTDARTATVVGIAEREVDAVSETYDRSEIQVSNTRLAIIATEGWPIAQMVERSMRAVGVTTVVFANVHVACTWLGVDAEPVLATIGELRQELRTRPDA